MNKTNEKYELATFWTRFSATSIDFLILILINALITFLTIYFVVDWNVPFQTEPYLKNHDLVSGMLLLSGFFNFVIWIIYLLIIPYFCRGYTLSRFFFKIRLVPKLKKDKFLKFIRHDFLIWIIFFIILMFLYSSTFAFNNPIKALLNFVSFAGAKTSEGNDNSKISIWSSFFQVALIVAFLPNLFFFVSGVVKKDRILIQDEISDCFVITNKIIKIEIVKDKWEKTEPKNVMPGVIEIDSIE